jgi:ubiquinone/menaquinone biosynthesis C-methylase UbiE
MIFNKKASIESNIKAHNRVAKKYESLHVEIYNEIEQKRLHQELLTATSKISTDSMTKTVIDFGCGAGNLTQHLTEIGLDVIACDVSQGFLNLINSRTYETNVETVKLNGKDISNIPNDSVDMLVTYSVLHHIPDYLSILNEFLRVLKKGGIIYIDHESSEDVWRKNEMRDLFNKQIKRKNKFLNKNWFILNNYFDWVIRKFINPRYRREGDIHVFPDDHIEWNKIIEIFEKNNGMVVYQKDYLLYKSNYDLSVYNEYKDEINDMHLLVVKKIN